MSEEDVIEIAEVEQEATDVNVPSVERYVQFIFNDKMVEFNVPWSQGQLQGLVTDVMKDDGYIWVPYDEERGTGAFINLNNCTNIKLVEREIMPAFEPAHEPQEVSFGEQPTMELEPQQPTEESIIDYLNYMSRRYGLVAKDTLFNKAPSVFWKAILQERYGFDEDGASEMLDVWRERRSEAGLN